MTETNSIYNENCLDTMKRYPDDFFNFVLTSPPYNMNLRIRNGKYCSRQILKEEFSNKYKNFTDNLPIEEFYELHTKILSELIRISKIVFYNYAIVTGSKKAFVKIINDHVDFYKDEIVWDKGHGQPAMQNGVLNRRTEKIVVFDKHYGLSRKFKKCNFDRGTLEDILEIPKQKRSNEINGATFPDELVRTIFSNFVKKGDTIYDPFLGRGTTCIIAKEMGINYVGSELDTEQFEQAKKNIG
jgi:site-specific DNA-methyltransferase (adenine-specific)/modification methylase